MEQEDTNIMHKSKKYSLNQPEHFMLKHEL
jgi:hypothetical protein